MRKRFLIIFLCAGLGLSSIVPAAAQTEPILQDQPLTSQLPNITSTIENSNITLNDQQQEIVVYDQPTDNRIYSDYSVILEDLYKYNIIALQNADINCHVRGSIWVGGTLIGNQYIDDGSLNGQIASDSYVYNNQSNLYFQSRTENQSLDAYKGLTEQAIDKAIEYWTHIILNFPNNGIDFIYIQPDENGYVDLKKWDYQASGSDEEMQQIPKVYWTNATYVEMGGLAGHLIAPYADIHIVSCNHRGSIVGWNIYTDGESHINYWTPELKGDEPTPVPTETPIPTETPVPTETPTPTITERPVPTQIETPTPIPTITPAKERPTPVPTDETHPPKTGDQINILSFILLFIISILLVISLSLLKKKKSI